MITRGLRLHLDTDVPSPSEPTDALPSTPLAWLREGGRPLLALLIVIAIAKLLIVASHESSNPLSDNLTSDQAYYVERAMGIAGTFDDPRALETYHLPPLYPHVLALMPGIERGDAAMARVVQAVLGVVALLGVYMFARRRSNRIGALVATGLTAAYGPITFFELKVLGDTLAFDALVGLLVVCDLWHAQPNVKRAAIAGVLTAIIALLRPQALLLAVFLLVWMARRHRASAAGFAVALALVVAPFTAHNIKASGDVIFISDNGGVNLWLANGSEAPVSGTFATNDREFGDIATQADVARARVEQQLGQRASAGEVSAHFRSRALSDIAEDPTTFLHRLGWRTLALVESFQTGIVVVPAIEAELIGPLAALALPFGLLAALAGAAVILLGPRPWVPRPQDDVRRPSWTPALAILAMVVITTLAFFHYERFRLITVPMLATLVGMAVARVVSRGRVNPSRAAGAVLVALGVMAVSFIEAPHHAPTLANGAASVGFALLDDAAEAGVAGRQRRAINLSEQASGWADRALEYKAGFVRALLLRARASLSKGDIDTARRTLDELDTLAPGLPDAEALRAFLNR